eukprot:CAMPEP_0113950782 /NCGR_PEP_ID=MMETSP1339-20121228/82556_1 /TAXON_ID=94617 /ORGANISM="Fibrocapsa japonica" /LENGTH=248 /DNA_ID=CAMNT_0000958751 /DNA_START=68 /DNA_END=814 /DNA_ORIENTATION=- /assembly_acc=CAM_ASM_000762
MIICPPSQGHFLTVEVGSGERQCFYSDVLPNDSQWKLGSKRVEVFVLVGGSLDIKLEVRGPLPLDSNQLPDVAADSKVLFDQVISSEKSGTDEEFGDSLTFDFVPSDVGAYEVCLDNSMSSKMGPTKVVQIAIKDLDAQKREREVIPGATEMQQQERLAEAHRRLELPESMTQFESNVEAIQGEIDKIYEKQERERHRLAIHTAMNQGSHSRMAMSSLVETGVFVVVSIFQIFFVRRWFEGKGAKQWA